MLVSGRAQLVRGVGDELALRCIACSRSVARRVERAEHLVERPGELGDLVVGLGLGDPPRGVAGRGDLARRRGQRGDRAHRAVGDRQAGEGGEQRCLRARRPRGTARGGSIVASTPSRAARVLEVGRGEPRGRGIGAVGDPQRPTSLNPGRGPSWRAEGCACDRRCPFRSTIADRGVVGSPTPRGRGVCDCAVACRDCSLDRRAGRRRADCSSPLKSSWIRSRASRPTTAAKTTRMTSVSAGRDGREAPADRPARGVRRADALQARSSPSAP